MRKLCSLVLLASLCSPLVAQAAVSITSSQNSDTGGTTGTTDAISAVACSGSDTLLMALAGSNSGAYPTGITKGSTALTLLTQVSIGGVSYNAIWYLIGASNTSETMTATWAAAQTGGAGVTAICLSGVHQTTPLGTPATGSNGSSSAVTGQTVSGSATDDLLIDSVSVSRADTGITADAGTTERTADTPLGGWSINGGSHASGSSQTSTWTITEAQTWSQILVNVAASGVSAQTFGFRRRLHQ